MELNGTDWQVNAAERQPGLARLLESLKSRNPGYGHTLTEILQQPLTWLDTAETTLANGARIASLVDPSELLLFTGSGSSEYAGDCVAPALQAELRRPVYSYSGGWLLTADPAALPQQPGLAVSLARSGDSPESSGVIDLLLEAAPAMRHLIITCNKSGRLVANHAGDRRVATITLDPKINDRSLVMTSSFTNMVIASRMLGYLGAPHRYRSTVRKLSNAALEVLSARFDELGQLARGPFERVVFLGSGCHFGAARESALKMLEMTSARVVTMAETYLGLRHGPMSFVNSDTLVVCYLSSDPVVAAYELDLIDEIHRKNLGWRHLLVGESIPSSAVRDGDAVLPFSAGGAMGDNNTAVLDVLVAQILAFHRCLHLGLSPDSPSEDGAISRVVSSFVVHKRQEAISLG